MERRKLTVGLLWHSVNSHNFGIGALTVANIALIRRIAGALGLDVTFAVIGWQDDRPPYVTDPDVTMIPFRPRSHLKRPDRLIAAIRRCDIVFDIGAGDSFSDLYGAKRFFYMAATKSLVLALGRPLVLSPQTIGPCRRRWTRGAAAWIMRRARAVVVRDRLSLDYARSICPAAEYVEAVDVAFDLPAGSHTLEPTEKIRVGLNVSGLLFNGGRAVAQRIGLHLDYRRLAAQMAACFTAMPDCELHLIGHVFADDPQEDDRRAMRELAAQFPSVVPAPEFASPMEAKGYIAAMDFFIGGRMHACIAAFSSGVPVIATAYSRKFAGLFGSLNYPWVADCTSESIPPVLERVAQGFAERRNLASQVAAGMRTARARLAAYEDVVAATLESVAGGTLPAPAARPARRIPYASTKRSGLISKL